MTQQASTPATYTRQSSTGHRNPRYKSVFCDTRGLSAPGTNARERNQRQRSHGSFAHTSLRRYPARNAQCGDTTYGPPRPKLGETTGYSVQRARRTASNGCERWPSIARTDSATLTSLAMTATHRSTLAMETLCGSTCDDPAPAPAPAPALVAIIASPER